MAVQFPLHTQQCLHCNSGVKKRLQEKQELQNSAWKKCLSSDQAANALQNSENWNGLNLR